MKKNLCIFFPFDYEGPCITENAPKVLYSGLSKDEEFIDEFDILNMRKSIYESDYNFLKRLEHSINNNINKYQLILVIGGNHISSYPLYNVSDKNSYISITLDAHRDCINTDNDITHASFLKYVDNNNNNEKLIIGNRDEFKLEEYNYFTKEYSKNVNYNEINELIYKSKGIYIDLDIDFFDPNVFPWTVSKLENGFSYNEFEEIISNIHLKKLKLFSISEYAPVLDHNYEGARFIKNIIYLIKNKLNNK